MIVPVTLVGTIVSEPNQQQTNRGVAVTKFVVTTSAKSFEGGRPLDVDVTTWSVSAFDKLAEYADTFAAVGQHVIVHGQAYESRWQRDGIERKTLEVRADALAPNALTAVEPARLTLVGTVQGEPSVDYEQGAPLVDLTVRTARWRAMGHGNPRQPHDVTDWSVVTSGAGAPALAEHYGDGADVIVYGEARGIERPRADGQGTYQDIEVWAEAIGPDLTRHEGRPA